MRSRRGYIDTPAALTITNGGMTWSQNLQRDLVDACQSTGGTESVRASKLPKKEQKVAVVEMVAGGWSFTVRDQDGAVYVWGESTDNPVDISDDTGPNVDVRLRSAGWRSFWVWSSRMGRQVLSNTRTDSIAITVSSRINLIRSNPPTHSRSR